MTHPAAPAPRGAAQGSPPAPLSGPDGPAASLVPRPGQGSEAAFAPAPAGPLTPTLALLLALAWPGAAAALSLDLPPGSTLAFADALAPGSHALATAPFADGALPLAPREGLVTRQAWQVPLASASVPSAAPSDAAPSASPSTAPPAATTLALLQPLRAQVEAQGLRVLLDCEVRACGGFDFRAGVEVLPPPAMFVDLGDFRYLSAEGERGALSLLVSRSGTTGFVQAIEVGPTPRRTVAGAPIESPSPPGPSGPDAPTDLDDGLEAGAPADASVAAPPGDLPADASPSAPATAPSAATPTASLGARLEAEGRVVLEGLAFASGSADLAPDGTPDGAAALDALAAWLAQDPSRRVVIVGHTDATGSLDANLALSRRRAQAVAGRLEAAPGVSPAQVEASGAGFLAPLATNLTPEGRDANRRVEAVALPPG